MNSRLMSASALALALVSFDAHAQTWPARSPRAIVPVAAGTITDIVPRVVFEQALGANRTEHHCREPSRRWDNHGCRFRRQGGSRRLHHPDQLGRAHNRAGGVSEPELQSGHRLFGCRFTWRCPERAGCFAGKRVQDGRRLCRRLRRQSRAP